ncbi:protein SAMBA isoform X1 [Tanacetum coccineum]|uniref:Protein SAMBA isoform X1 n=2 Tax=Tanacetum coccineum TaxID=301880 RepID=A0ABQ5BEL8_9ASTR
MSNSSLTSSPARSSISTTAIMGANMISSSLVDDVHFATDLIQDRKDEALRALKADLMASLNKEVRMLEEDNWMFEGPRSRIHLISRPGGLLSKHAETMKHRLATQKRNQNLSIK